VTWQRTTLSAFLGDRVVYRNLEPQDAAIPGLRTFWAEAGPSRYAIPRKATPEYAAVVLRMAQAAQRARGVADPLRRILFVGDTRMGDGTTALLLGEHLPTYGLVVAERASEPAHCEWQGNLFLANRWSALADLDATLRRRGDPCDASTVVLLDLDKTSLGARGRNDAAIDSARVRAMMRALREALGDGVSEEAFRAAYEPLNQPRWHPFTADNQDYVAYVALMVIAGVVPADDLWPALHSGALRSMDEFVALCDERRNAMHGALRAAHDEVRHGLANGDPTPYKAFRRAEYVETVGAMDVLPDGASAEQVLAREIVITAEVASMAAHWAAQGALVLGLSDKPDEASLPTPEHAASGWQPLHRAVMKVYGQYLA